LWSGKEAREQNRPVLWASEAIIRLTPAPVGFLAWLLAGIPHGTKHRARKLEVSSGCRQTDKAAGGAIAAGAGVTEDQFGIT